MYEAEITALNTRIREREAANEADRLEIVRLKLARHFSQFSDLNMSGDIEKSVFIKVAGIVGDEDYNTKHALERLDLDHEFTLAKERLTHGAGTAVVV